MHPMSPNRPRIGRVPAPAVNGFGAVVIACGPSRPVRTAHPMALGMALTHMARGFNEPEVFAFRRINQGADNLARRAGRTSHPMRSGLATYRAGFMEPTLTRLVSLSNAFTHPMRGGMARTSLQRLGLL